MAENDKTPRKVSFLHKIWTKISTIEKALLGDEYNGHGVMKRLSIAETDIDALKKFRDKVVYTATGISLAIGTLFTIVNYIMNLKK